PVAEETGLINAIGRWVFETVCCQLQLWQQKFRLPEGFRASVNLSVQQLQDANLVSTITQVMAECQLPGTLLELEVTESLLLQRTDENLRRLADIRSLGVGIALDDFGTGYSSMSYLAQLPLTVIKIDKVFIDDIARSQGSAIVSAVLALARGLDVDVVAEGVETAEQSRALTALGCRYAQGYHFGRPVGTEEIDALFTENFPLAGTTAASG